MRKTLALILVLALCMSLVGCGEGGGKTLTAAEIEEALAGCKGTLEMDTSGDKVTAFTYVVDDINAEDLIDKTYAREAISAILKGNTAEITIGQLKASRAISAIMGIDTLFTDEEEKFDADAFVEKVLGILCDGNTMQYDGWSLSAKVDVAADSVTISVGSK